MNLISSTKYAREKIENTFRTILSEIFFCGPPCIHPELGTVVFDTNNPDLLILIFTMSTFNFSYPFRYNYTTDII